MKKFAKAFGDINDMAISLTGINVIQYS